MPDISDLRQRQALPLRAKVLMSQNRIREWYNHFDGDVYVAFSGGKDSTVLAHIVHDIYPDVPLVFANTGLEYPEIQSFARKMGAEFVRPKMSFSDVISTYGYPIISKENAEAIYYARRIRNGEGGGTGTQSRNAWNFSDFGQKTAGTQRTERFCTGGGTRKQTDGEQTLQKGATTRKPPVMHMGGVQTESVRRNLLMGGNGKIRTGVGGSCGEETASPG